MVELFEIRYYRLNKILLSLIGQWPFQSILKARISFCIMMIFISFQLSLQVTSTICYWPDVDMFVESGSTILIAFLSTVKLINCIINSKKMKILLLKMQRHWTSLNGSYEVEILNNYATISQKMTVLYTKLLYTIVSIFMIVPTLQSIAENVLPGRNETYPLLFPVDNIVNVTKYHKFVLIQSYISSFYFITIMVSADTMFLTYATHGCGMFAVLRHQLENVLLRNSEMWCNSADNQVHEEIFKHIRSHVEILNFSDLLESTYSTTFLLQLGINVIAMSVTGVQVVVNLDNPDQAMRFLSSGLGQILHLYMNTLPCQRLIDHSFGIRDAVYFSPWYLIPLKMRPLMQIISMRAITPCQITAGKLYVMTMENFSAVLKTSMTYFTVLMSVK